MSGLRTVVIISADGEWDAIHRIFPDEKYRKTPYGEWFITQLAGEQVVIMHGGWGKVPSAASCQYALNRWSPQLVLNLGTCGGFRGQVKRFDIVLAEKTVIYDIKSQMSDPKATVARTITKIDLDWLDSDTPLKVRRGTIASGDRDIHPDDVSMLQEKYGAIVGDWESGSIAYVCNRNNVRFLILRGVSDIVGPHGGEAYEGNKRLWYQSADRIIRELVASIPGWLGKIFPR